MSQEAKLREALRWALEWIDAVPQDTRLPAMPGFDRDYVNGLIASPVQGAASMADLVQAKQCEPARRMVELTQGAASSEARDAALEDAMLFGTGFYRQNSDGTAEHIPADQMWIVKSDAASASGEAKGAAVKPWQERYSEVRAKGIPKEPLVAGVACRDAEIADWRALAERAQAAQPSGAVLLDLSKLMRHDALIAPMGYDYVVEMAEREDGEWVRYADLEELLATPAPEQEAAPTQHPHTSQEVHVITCDDLLKDAEQDLDDGYGAAACSFRNAARDALEPFNLQRHTIVVTEHGLKVRAGRDSRHYWELRSNESPVIHAIYAVGMAIEKLPQPVLDKLVGVCF